ncbi:MAG: hypothetical protein KF688_13695 [Pirellulales bacterium]|nr:hypothetical protein [Pirellulales bacterium]
MSDANLQFAATTPGKPIGDGLLLEFRGRDVPGAGIVDFSVDRCKGVVEHRAPEAIVAAFERLPELGRNTAGPRLPIANQRSESEQDKKRLE